MSLMQMVVPVDLAAEEVSFNTPAWSNSSFAPASCPSWRVTTLNSARAHSELRASPRNPNVPRSCAAPAVCQGTKFASVIGRVGRDGRGGRQYTAWIVQIVSPSPSSPFSYLLPPPPLDVVCGRLAPSPKTPEELGRRGGEVPSSQTKPRFSQLLAKNAIQMLAINLAHLLVGQARRGGVVWAEFVCSSSLVEDLHILVGNEEERQLIIKSTKDQC